MCDVSCTLYVLAGSLAVAVLQGMTEKTCAPEHDTEEALTHTDTHSDTHTEEEDRQGAGVGEAERKGRGGEEVGRGMSGGEARGKEGNVEKEEIGSAACRESV